jgi:hypothetical protein
MQAPVGIILIHRAKAHEAHLRDQHARQIEPPPTAVRAAIGRILIAAGLWLAPHHDGAEPAIGRLSTAR